MQNRDMGKSAPSPLLQLRGILTKYDYGLKGKCFNFKKRLTTKAF